MFVPVTAQNNDAIFQEHIQHEMLSDPTYSLADADSGMDTQATEIKSMITKDTISILQLFLVLIGIMASCFMSKILGKVVEEKIYASIASDQGQ